MQHVTADDGLAVAVHHLGGDGRPLLFSHATGFHGRTWLPVARHLFDEFACWAVDLRAHGDTPASPDGDRRWSRAAADLLAVVDQLDLGFDVVGAGHSFGGACLALAEEARPGTFAGLFLYEPIIPPFDPPVGLVPGAGGGLAEGARRRREVFESRAAAHANYASKPPWRDLHPDALDAYVDFGFDDLPDGTVRLKCRGEDEALTFENSMEHDAFVRLDRVRIPVTVAVGAAGSDVPAQFGPPVVERLPAGRLLKMAGLDHFGPFADPAAVAAAIADVANEAAGPIRR